MLQPQRTSSPSPTKGPFSRSVPCTTDRLKDRCLKANSQMAMHAIFECSTRRCIAHLMDGRVPVTSTEKSQENTKCFWKKTCCKSYSSSQLAQCGGAKSSMLSRIWGEGFLLPLAQKQHFVLCALFILETLLDKLLEGLINCKDLSVFPKQSGC